MQPIPLEQNKLVVCTWLDSHFAKGWHSKIEKTCEIPEIVSVGFVTHCDETMVELSGHISQEGSRLNPTSIPWAAITELVEK